MKPTIFAALFFAVLASNTASLCAADTDWFSYMPAVSTLTGTITEESYGEDASPNDRGAKVWILHLDRPISVRATPKDEINVQELHVSEVHLNIAHRKHPIAKKQFGTVRFTAIGTLYHQFNSHHLRPIVMLGSDLKPAKAK